MDPLSTYGLFHRRRRRSFVWSVVALGTAVSLVLFSLGAAYEVGLSQTRSEVERLIADLEAQRDQNRELSARVATAEQRAEQAREEAVRLSGVGVAGQPSRPGLHPDLEPLLRLSERKLAEGVPLERITKVVEELRRERNCLAKVETKRLAVRTAISRDASPTGFADGLFQIQASGATARSANGLSEAWFDPAKPIDLAIKLRTGQPRTASGTLPFEHAVVIDRREYIFQARSHERRGFVELALRVCDYP